MPPATMSRALLLAAATLLTGCGPAADPSDDSTDSVPAADALSPGTANGAEAQVASDTNETASSPTGSAANTADLPRASSACPPLAKGLVVGTWTPPEDSGFEQTWIDEAGLRETFTKQKAGRRAWRGFGSASDETLVDALLNDREGPAVGYLFTLVQRMGEDGEWPDRDAVLHLRHRGRVSAHFDGALIVDAPAPRAGTWGEVRIPVRLTGAFDVVLLKLGRGAPQLGDSMNVDLRISNPDGSPMDGQGWNTMRPSGFPSDI